MTVENHSPTGVASDSARILSFPAMTRPIDQLPNRVRAYRKRAGMTLAQVAKAMNMTEGHISNIERGDRELTAPVMIRLAGILDCKAADLLAAEHGGLSPEERDLVSTYQQIPDAHRNTLRAVAEAQQPYRAQPAVVPFGGSPEGAAKDQRRSA